MSTGATSPPARDPAVFTEPLRPDVLAAAQSRQFGPPVVSRRLPNPFAVFGGSLVVSLVCLGLLVLVSYFGADMDGGVLRTLLRAVALFFCFAFVGALAYGLAALARGAQSFHVFAGGFVHRKNGGVRALAWPELAELRPFVMKKGDAAGKIRNYELVPHTGKKISVPLVVMDGRDAFMDQLMAALRHNGIPVR